MYRLLSCGLRVWLVLGALGVATRAVAQEPVEQISAPRTDLYSTYTDAFYNPQSVVPCGHESEEATRRWRLGPAFRVYAGYDILHYYRTKPANKVLVRTTNNIFDTDPVNDITPNFNQLSATPGTSLFPVDVTGQVGSRPGNPNDSGLRMNVPAGTRFFPNEILMQSDDFDFDGQEGHRPRLGIELPSGSRIEFTYFLVRDFRATPLIQDARNFAFFTQYVNGDGGGLDSFGFQRFGTLNAPFLLPVSTDSTGLPTDGRFLGEQRRISSASNISPHNPANEIPGPFDPQTTPNLGPGPVPGDDILSTDVPREPTNTDPATLGVVDARYDLSLLWTDGELAIARYSFDMQGGELAYSRPIFTFEQRAWQLRLLASVRYIALDEAFDFFFADTVFDRAQVNDTAVIPLPQPPGGGPLIAFETPQSVNETQATYVAGIDNDMVGPELGIDARLPFLSVFELDLMGKAGWMANFLENHMRLYRPDGVELYNYRKNFTGSSGIFEGQMGLNFRPHPNVTLRGGWEFLYLVNVGTGIGNIHFDLDQRPRPKNNDSVLFHGWFAGAEVLF